VVAVPAPVSVEHSLAHVAVRAPGPHRSKDISEKIVSDANTAELAALPFLGALTCATAAVVAGSTEELVLTYTVGRSGIADSGWLKLCFRYYSDWDLQTADAGGRDFASARVLSRSLLGGACADGAATAQRLTTRYDVKGGERPFQKSLLIHVVDGYLRPGDVIEIRLGDRRFGGPGTRVQTFVEDEFELHLFVDALGTSRMAHAAVCRLAVLAGPPERLVVHGPRLVRSDCAGAQLRAHLQDRWGNACRDVPATMRAFVGGTAVASVNTPEHGWAYATISVPARAGRIQVHAASESLSVPPAECQLDVIDDFPSPRALFCDLHIHSNDTVGTQDTAWNLAFGRDIGGLDVAGYTANDFQITDAAWAGVVAACREISTDGEFVCYPGVEWCGTSGVGGDHNVVFVGEDTTLARSLEWHQAMRGTEPVPQTWPITQLYAAYDHDPDSYLLIPHVGGRRAVLDWHHPQLERLIEIHSAWGSSPWFFDDALTRGLKLGASAASDEHRGRPGGGAPGANIFGGFGGLTGVLAPELTRAAMGKALRSRRTWASTGARAVALLRSGDDWMGDEIWTTAAESDVHYDLYGATGWEELSLCDTAGRLWLRDLQAEARLSDTLVRIRWGGARHRDRYRWATWAGRLVVNGADIEAVRPWAATHPEQHFDHTGDAVNWHTTTYGTDIGVVIRLSALSDASVQVCSTVLEDRLDAQLAVSGAELLDNPRREISVGGLNLKIVVERIAEPDSLPLNASGQVRLELPAGDAAVYLRARQCDGHQVWTSPLFFARPQDQSC
jgi:hypothetical protein